MKGGYEEWKDWKGVGRDSLPSRQPPQSDKRSPFQAPPPRHRPQPRW